MTSYRATIWPVPAPGASAGESDGRLSDTAGAPSSARAPRTVEINADDLAAALADPTTLVWIDLLAPSARELAEVGSRAGLHSLEIEDAIAPLERPKATLHPDHVSFVTYAITPRADVRAAMSAETAEHRLEATELSTRADHHVDHPDDAEASAFDAVLEGDTGQAFGDSLFCHTRITGFVLAHALITVRSGDEFALAPVRERWADLDEGGALGPFGLVHGLLDVIVDQYFEAVQFLDDRIEDLEDDLFEPAGRLRNFQRRAFALRKELVALRRVILPMRDVLGSLGRRRAGAGGASSLAAPGGGEHGGGESRAADPRALARLEALYADLQDHVLRAAEWTESLRDMISTVFETHLSLQDQRLNEVMKKLAGWAAVISVPTLVTGWFGMNVPYPGHDSVTGLAVATLLVLVPAAVLWWVLRRQGWL